MSRPVDRSNEVFFTPAQLGYLEQLFPAVVLGSTTTEAAMRHYFGQQAVLTAVRNRTRGIQPRTFNPSPDDIPTPA